MASFDMTKLRVPLTGLILLLASGLVMAQFHRKIRSEEQAPVAPPVFDHYVLELGWAPNFCAQPDAAAANPKECAPGRGIGFVVHGFQPEAGDGKSLSGCGPAKTVPKPVVNMVLRYMLSPTRIQSAWAAEGICTGLKPGEYFGNILQTRTGVQIPVQLTSAEGVLTETPEQIETQFAGANPGFPKTAFRTFCDRGALAETRICFDKALKPQACPAGEAECATQAILIRRPR
jgi:ribonuclease T2